MDRFTLDAHVFRMLSAAAAKGEPCPTCHAMGGALDVSEKAARLSVKRLEAEGRISIDGQVGCRRRVVHILETGVSTAPEILRVGEKVEPEVAPAAGSLFDEAMERCGGWFEDHPRAMVRRGRTIYAPARAAQFSECGISGVYSE